MKKILSKYLVLVLGSLMSVSGLTSCDDYLMVRPKSDYPDYQLFSNVGGFKDAVVGLYVLARENVYYPDGPVFGGANAGDASGSAITTSLLEPISCFWPAPNDDTNSRLYRHLYTAPDGTIHQGLKGFYTGQYKLVTNANEILRWIDDEQQDFLDDDMYSMIKGETLGMKAYVMFDLIRTFGPPPGSTSLHNSTYLAYPKDITVDTYPDETYTRYMELLMEDLNEAERLLGKYDPIQPSITLPTNHPHGNWMSLNRSSRLNYYGILALQARLHLWTGNKAKALEYAEKVIAATNADGGDLYTLTPSTGFGEVFNGYITASNDLYCMSEQIFGLHYSIEYRYTYTTSSWGFYLVTSYLTSPPATDEPYFKHFEDVFGELEYKLAGSNPTTHGIKSNDARFARTFALYKDTRAMERAPGWYTFPVKSSPLTSTTNNTQLPMLRLAEMYLIVAECETLAKATEYINDLRRSRWIGSTELDYSETLGGYEELPVFANEAERMKAIYREYTAEFQQEGQVFFMHKRLGLDRIQYPSMRHYTTELEWKGEVLMDDSKYTVPTPTLW